MTNEDPVKNLVNMLKCLKLHIGTLFNNNQQYMYTLNNRWYFVTALNDADIHSGNTRAFILQEVLFKDNTFTEMFFTIFPKQRKDVFYDIRRISKALNDGIKNKVLVPELIGNVYEPVHFSIEEFIKGCDWTVDDKMMYLASYPVLNVKDGLNMIRVQSTETDKFKYHFYLPWKSGVNTVSWNFNKTAIPNKFNLCVYVYKKQTYKFLFEYETPVLSVKSIQPFVIFQ